ncbi:TIGR03668 family PPOX class F420-dependent oxidoreductase [Salinactinospora qingdaonensis]|uniref:TIGR03668 family PPOX class F420-dependent oxidoreductase n=1 Tax=Salinactinospora qingdaonensis TaxID=702744 RepID=A0ABP7FFL1_9ACTN
MRWTPEQTRDAFAGSRVARLATVTETGQPHLVPVTFAVIGDTIAVAIDTKPKRTKNLKRLANIEANPNVCLLVDHYSDDWQQLWWARADGTARIVHAGTERDHALARLRERYPQYHADPPEGPVILAAIDRWSGWSFRQYRQCCEDLEGGDRRAG